MTPDQVVNPEWVVVVKSDTGEEIEAGRFLTVGQAHEFVQLYGIPKWKIIRRKVGSSS